MTQQSKRPARPARGRGGAAPQAPARLDARGESLSNALPSIYAAMQAEIGAAVDEVTVTVEAERVVDACMVAKEHPDLDFDYLRCLSAVDYVERIEVDYHVFSLRWRHKMVIKTNLQPEAPRVGTVIPVWRGADWFEREAHDLFGIVFVGHPNPSPLLLYDGFDGYPGLRSFPYHEYEEW